MIFRTFSQSIAGALLLGAALGSPFISSAAYAQAGGYRVLHHWTVGGEGGWDYLEVDAATHRLYLAHNSTVNVVDTDTGKSVGAITGLQSTHGIALDPTGKYGYISDGKGNAIVVFDRHSLAKIATVPAGTNPDGIAYEPVTKTVWAFNGRSGDVSVLSTATNKIVATVKLPGKPEFPVADGKGFVFDNIEDKNEIVKLDAHTNKLVATYPLEGCDAPSGLAMDRKGRRLFSMCDSKVMTITSADTGKVMATAPIGDGPDADRYDPKHNLAFSPNGESGDMTIVDAHGAKPTVLQTLKTAPGARTMALDEMTGRVYTMTAQFGPKPAPSASNPHGRPTPVPGSFEVIEIGR
jgi:YVTN family beta-propeller protein